LTVTYTNTLVDVLALNANHFFRNWPNRVALALCGLFILQVALDATADSPDLGYRVFGVIFLEVVGLAIAVALMAAVTAAVAVFQNKTGILTEHTVTVDDEGVSEKTAVNEGLARWAAVTRIAWTGWHIFVYVGPNAAHMIPRRAFDSESEYDKLHETLVMLWAQSRA
jgi:hypothetical protein